MFRSSPGIALIASLVLASGCGNDPVGQPVDGGGDGDRGLVFPDAIVPPDSQGPACTKNDECGGGVCLEGNCCVSAEQVCGKLCCAAGKKCFANACVTPGKLCYSAGDCDPGQYCEPTLGPGGGSADGGVATPDAGAGSDSGAGGPVCLQPPPRAGRCLDLPTRCGTTPTPGCLPACEYKPPVGKLSAKQKWSWGEGTAKTYKDHVDVWSTPVVGRLTDTNCDGKVNELDPPNIIFVSGNGEGSQCAAKPPACLTGVLRVLDGATGQEIWSLRKPGPGTTGFAALTMALGDVDRDGHLEIVAVDSNGHVVLIDYTGKLLATSDKPIPEAIKGDGTVNTGFGWGGGLALADMNGDGKVEVAYGRSIFTIDGNTITLIGAGTHGAAVGGTRALSAFSDLDGDGKQELLGGNAAYRYDGKTVSDLWYNAALGDGYPAVADFDGDGKPEVVLLISTGADKGSLVILAGKTGDVLAGPLLLPGTGNGGPPTVADFDGDGKPEVGVAKADYYSVTKVDLKATKAADKLKVLWQQVNHDFSSSVTGSTVFDFEGDGAAEVIYNDECFIWVYDGKTGDVKFAHPTTSFTGTEAALVADVDGDGRAEMVMMANRASPTNWKCNVEPWTSPDPVLGRPAWVPPTGRTAWSGITVFGDKANSWVGTRTLWNQHSYHVSNICDSRDGACYGTENQYGVIPKLEKTNFTIKWLNNFRQNVQDKGIFDAPDPALSLRVDCENGIEGSTGSMTLRATLRNLGLALLPDGVKVGFYVVEAGGDRKLGEQTTTSMLFPGQAVELTYGTKATDNVTAQSSFIAKILIDPTNPTFHECRDDNNTSEVAKNPCILR